MRAIRTASRGLATVLIGLWLAAAPISAWARDTASERNHSSRLVSVGAALGSLVYTPSKIAYAVTGTVLSGMAWVWTGGDDAVAGPIFKSAIRGDYVIVPAHLAGRRSVEFLGSPY